MASDSKRRGKRKAGRQQAGGYKPVRGPRLKGSAGPEPETAPAAPDIARDEPARLDEADEVGLRMLAALETMESLEPDFADDLSGEEASVTIIERAAPLPVPPPLAAAEAERAPARKRRRNEAPAVSDTHAGGLAAYPGPIEEAVVEIFDGPAPEPAASGRRQKRAHPLPHRFFKALTGGEGE